MNKSYSQTMSTGQLFVLVFSMGSCLKMLMLPVLLVKASGRNATVALVGILIGEMLCLAGMGIAMKKAPNKSFLALVRESMGKVGEKIVAALFFALFFLKALLLCNEARIFFAEGFMSETPWGVYALPMVAFCVLFGMGSARQIGRCAQILFPFIAISTFMLFLFISSGADFGALLPLFEGAKLPVVRMSVRYAMWYGDYSTLTAFFGSVKRTKHTLLLANLAGLLASAAVLLFGIGLITAFADIGDLLRFGQNVAGLSRSSLLGPASGRFDLLVFCMWLMSAFIKAGVFVYATATFLAGLLGISRGAASVSTGVLLYGIVLACGSSIALRTFFGHISGAMLVLQFLIPLFSLLLAALSNRREKKGGAVESSEDGAQKPQESGKESVKEAPQTERTGTGVAMPEPQEGGL